MKTTIKPPAATQILYWCRTDNDSRYTASDVGCLNVFSQKDALPIARDIDDRGQPAIDGAIAAGQVAYSRAVKHPAAPGHGVTIQYMSGRCREVVGN